MTPRKSCSSPLYPSLDMRARAFRSNVALRADDGDVVVVLRENSLKIHEFFSRESERGAKGGKRARSFIVECFLIFEAGEVGSRREREREREILFGL